VENSCDRLAARGGDRRLNDTNGRIVDLKEEKVYELDVKETGQTKTMAGHNTREVVMTVTVREKGRTLDEGGGMVMTSKAWMAAAIPAMKELPDFELR